MGFREVHQGCNEGKTSVVFSLRNWGGRLRRRTRTSFVERERRCRREAVHVVVALGLGHRVRSADVQGGGDRGGYVDIDYDVRKQVPQDRHFDDMTVNLGPYTDEVARETYDRASVNDIGSAVNHALSIIALNLSPTGYAGSLTLDQLIAAARDRARSIVDNHAAAIARIAALLVLRQEISAREIEQAWRDPQTDGPLR